VRTFCTSSSRPESGRGGRAANAGDLARRYAGSPAARPGQRSTESATSLTVWVHPGMPPSPLSADPQSRERQRQPRLRRTDPPMFARRQEHFRYVSGAVAGRWFRADPDNLGSGAAETAGMEARARLQSHRLRRRLPANIGERVTSTSDTYRREQR
jgi:hypothetical protein